MCSLHASGEDAAEPSTKGTVEPERHGLAQREDCAGGGERPVNCAHGVGAAAAVARFERAARRAGGPCERETMRTMMSDDERIAQGSGGHLREKASPWRWPAGARNMLTASEGRAQVGGRSEGEGKVHWCSSSPSWAIILAMASPGRAPASTARRGAGSRAGGGRRRAAARRGILDGALKGAEVGAIDGRSRSKASSLLLREPSRQIGAREDEGARGVTATTSH